jgi:phosphoenolpyruvate carboxykinase (ATP)
MNSDGAGTSGASPIDLRSVGIVHPGLVHHNLAPAALCEHAVRRKEGILTSLGAFAAFTGARTGRSPKDKFIVREPSVEAHINWGPVNQPVSPATFAHLRDLVTAYLQNRELFVFDGFAAADPKHRISLRVVSEKAWHNLFARCLFRRPTPAELQSFTPQWTVLHAPDFHPDPARDGTNSEVMVAISFEQKLVVAAGPHYAGEIKKSIFTILNYLLPRAGVLSMHCSANVGAGGDVALFFGLSGTGKTTLSADPERRLIGDDEHGWGDEGVFNIEGGCYAKTIKLSREKEPQIYDAIRFGCVLENVPIDPFTRVPDFDSAVFTENTRAAYPIDFIPGHEASGRGGHPANIFFLTCDAFGVLPPIARLSPDQAMQQFLCGYTAKLAGTETGVTEPGATFSTCFGAPFMPLPPKVYGNMLKERMQRFHVPVYLVNTGWSGGGVGVGSRMKLAWTRTLLKAAMTGALKNVPFATDPVFGLSVPTACPDVPSEVLMPRNTWTDRAAYDATAAKLKGMFDAEAKKYT